MFGEAVAVMYNKKLLPGGVPTTWDAFVKTAQSLTKPEQQQFGFLAPIGIQYYMHGFYHAFGGYVFARNGKNLDAANIGLNNEGAVKAGQLINDLRFKLNLIPEGAENWDTEKDLFNKGKLAMWLTGPWAATDTKKAGIDYGVGQLPRPTGATRDFAPFVGIRGAVVSAYSKNKAAAAEFAKYITAPEQQVALNQAGGRVPVSKRALAQLKNNVDVQGFGAAVARGVPMPNIAAMDKVWGPWGDALSLVIKTNNADVKGLHDKAVQTMKSTIK
jgi:arabinogalactan oligomer/maltooligosaccharide transport system substrate-binding protein